MAFVTGAANNFTDLLAALRNACTANGWTLDGNVLHKGTCFIEVTYDAVNACLKVQGGNGQAGGVLSGRADVGAAVLGVVAASTNTPSIPAHNVPFTFPLSYDIHVHAAPDEVILVVNYGVTFYQFLAFGQSAAAGLTGTGNWFAATQCAGVYAVTDVDQRAGGGFMEGGYFNGGLFMQLSGYAASSANGALDHQLDSATWAVEGAWRDWYDLQANTPNAWNSESVLNPVRVYAQRPSGFISQVAEFAHARFVNLGSLQDQQILTIGPDKWKVYPWWARGTPYDANDGTYSGVAGHAFRYDGP